ncbi:MAG: ABC transporter substrate-binding protein [Myxococcales bacterium]
MRVRVVCALVFAIGCRKAEKPAAQRAAAPLPDRIVIGATLPVSSAEGQTARFYREGYELAIEEANRAGGVAVGGRRIPISLELLDDGGDPSVAAARVKTLVEEKKASFLLGSASQGVVEAESAIADARRIPYVTAGGESKALYQRGLRWFFGVQGPVQLLAYTQMRWIDEQQKARRLPTPLTVAVLVEDSPRGLDFAQGVRDFAGKTPSRRTSYRIVFDERFPPSQQDFTAQLQRLKQAHADAFLADSTLSEFLTLHRRYLWLGLCHKVVSYGAHGGELQALEEFGFPGLSYILSALWWSPRLAKRGLNRQFFDEFKDTFHRDPDWYGALAYEAARALLAAIAASGDASHEGVRAQLASMKMESILPGGRLMFGPDQQAIYPFVVQQNQPDGSSPVIFPNDVAESPGVPVNPRCP